jgi:amino-acid N-acetyltransferase
MMISIVNQNNLSAATDLLRSNKLPTDDLSTRTTLFVAEEQNNVVGTVGLEHDTADGLLRSLSVSEEKRNAGIGQKLVHHIEGYAKKQGLKNLYLLTTTAASFFSKRGYTVVDRSDVSQFIKTTSEFCSVCPSSATLMKKEL